MQKISKRKYVKKSVKWLLGTARQKRSKTLVEEPYTANMNILASAADLVPPNMTYDASHDAFYINSLIQEIDDSFQNCLCEFCLCAKMSGFNHEPIITSHLRNNGFLFE